MKTNILILSAGTRNKIVQYFKKALTDKNGSRTGSVIATDMSDIAPAVYEADKFYKVSRMTEPCYINEILKICKAEKIKGVLSLIDPELSLLAAHKKDFEDIGTTVIGSDYSLCEMSLDKYQMYKWLSEHKYSCAKSFIDFNEFLNSNIGYPVFVKPSCGSASIAISKAKDEQTAHFLFNSQPGMMIQQFLDGQEIGADVYIDMISKKVVSIFTKKKIVMRAGETDKAVSFKDQKLFDLIEKFVLQAGYVGQIDIDIFDVNGNYCISEVNPRFGGGYPHAYECGTDHMKLIINNLNGIENKPNIGSYDDGLYMMKYNEIMIKR